ncbi:MAG TPA: energy transducer TonB [Polyangia bacterium]|jgi:protein TonB|nr:energy transducer TonB [Polyangia bacterium]
MRLTASLLSAVALHAVVFGVAAAVLSRQIAPHREPVTVEVEVISPKPDPIADSAVTAAAAPAKRTAPPRPRINLRHREVALVSDSAPGEPPATSDAPSPVSSVLAPTAAPAASLVRARVSEAPSVGKVVSAEPRYRTNPRPDYPVPCKRRREEGIVLLNVAVHADGLPAAISLNRSSGYPLLDRAALDAVRRWTFEPGRAAGVPVSSTVVVPVRFSLSEEP